MSPHTLVAASAIDLNQPGHYLSWSIFDISVANLVVIAVMVVIFGLALLIPFPQRHAAQADTGTGTLAGAVPDESGAAPDDPDAGMWTNKVRRFALRVLPPGKLLPDRQPAYVASWIYVFGVATLATLGLALASGFALALGGPDWYHYNSAGHFFNSLHLWSVELFMAFMVIHLWGKFWLAAWRGRRAMTWITGVVAFMASVVECFTGYLSQSNFDSQWIATNGKDAFNAVGAGAFFNVMNFGQMLMWHIVLIPIILVAIVGAHVLMVRARGVSHPLPARPPISRDRKTRRAAAAADAAPRRGATRRYDILKEGTAAFAVASILNWQKLSGVTQPFDAAKTYVISPLSQLAPTTPALAAALGTYTSASSAQQLSWATAYDKAMTNGKVAFNNGLLAVPAAGPVPVMMAYELKMAQAGTLDADLLAQTKFFGTNYTKPLLFIADGGYYANLATTLHLTGGQWGVMNETGSYPGQPWLWLYQLWYHVAPFSNSANVDIWAVYLTGIATILLLLIPFIPGLRDIPRLLPVHRLIWRGDWTPGGPPAAPVTDTVPATAQTAPGTEGAATP